jgi:hypothetical protein
MRAQSTGPEVLSGASANLDEGILEVDMLDGQRQTSRDDDDDARFYLHHEENATFNNTCK